jgi:histidine triad (HIT) family protein
MGSDDIFCMIVRGEIPAKIVYQDDAIVAFNDVNPQAPVHVVVVPREHYAALDDEVPAEVLGALLAAAVRVAEVMGVADTGYRTIINTGRDAGQSVPHLHLHVLGGAPMSPGLVRLA